MASMLKLAVSLKKLEIWRSHLWQQVTFTMPAAAKAIGNFTVEVPVT